MSFPIQTYQNGTWQPLCPDFALHGSLERAVVVSLFTDAMAQPDDHPPGGPDDKRGWWADAMGMIGPNMGSRLWLLERSKATDETAMLAEEYAKEALTWLMDDGWLSAVDVTAEWDGAMLFLTIEMTLTDGNIQILHLAK